MIDERKLIKYLRYNKYQFVLNVREEKILDNIIKAIDKQPKIENTLGFKHFKMYSDSTLKSMNKDDLIDYIHTIYNNYKACDYFYNNAIDENYRLSNQLVECQRVAKKKQEIIEELTSNPPLKFEDLKPNTWVFDNKIKEYRKIDRVNKKYRGFEYFDAYGWFIEFEENRFYLKEVKEDVHK